MDSLLKSPHQIEGIKRASKLLSLCFKNVTKLLKPGVTAEYIEYVIHNFLSDRGATPSFKEIKNYPFCSAISINREICHGFPQKKIISRGDTVTLDIGLRYRGYCADMAKTFIIERGSPALRNFYWKAYSCFRTSLISLKQGDPISKLSKVLARETNRCNLVVYPEFAGHGIGASPHEQPKIYHVGVGEEFILKKNMVFTIEPIFGTRYVRPNLDVNGFTYVCEQNNYTASFEHTVMMGERGLELLTQW